MDEVPKKVPLMKLKRKPFFPAKYLSPPPLENIGDEENSNENGSKDTLKSECQQNKVMVKVPNLKLKRKPFFPAKYYPQLLKNEINLLELPIELIEKIVLYLDGFSVMELEDCSHVSKKIVYEILRGKLGYEFWKDQCFELVRKPLMFNIMGSFFNLVEEKLRFEKTHCDSKEIFLNARMEYSYEDIFRVASDLTTILENSEMEMEYLTAESQIKHEMFVNYERSRLTRFPKRFTSTSGGLLFNIMIPVARSQFEPNCLNIYEDMKTIRRDTIIPHENEKLFDYIIMTLPIEKPIKDLLTNIRKPLPKIWKIFIGIFEHSVYLSSLNEGKSLRIPTGYYPQAQYRVHMHTRVATVGHFLAVWANSVSFRVYHVMVDPENGDVTADLVQELIIPGMFSLWYHVAVSTDHYMNYFYSAESAANTSIHNIPIFLLLSPRFGSYVFATGQNRLILHRPKYSSKDICCKKVDFEFPIGHAKGDGTFIFWTIDTLAVGYGISNWHLEKWSRMKIYEFVGQAEVITTGCIIFSTQTEIIIIKLNYEYIFKPYHEEYKFIEIIRRIHTDKNSFIEYFHFDFDKGIPYIFLNLGSPTPCSGNNLAYNFFLRKIKFNTKNDTDNESKEKNEEEKSELSDLQLSFFLDKKNQRIVSLLKALKLA